MGKWVLIGFGIIALTTGFVLYMANSSRPTDSSMAPETVDSKVTRAPQTSSTEIESPSPAEQPIASQEDYQMFHHSSEVATESNTRDISDNPIDQPEAQAHAHAAGTSSVNTAASFSRPEVGKSGSIEPEQGLVGEMPNPQGVPVVDPEIPVDESVPIYSDPMADVSGTATGVLLPGEGEPPYTGPLPGENEPDVVGPLPGENEPPYTGPLPGENELPATGPLPGEEGPP